MDTTQEEQKETIQEQATNVQQLEQEVIQPLVDTMTDSFLKSEIEKNKDLTKKIWRWGGLAVIALAIYFTALLSSVKSVVFDSDGIAAIVANEIDQKLPEQVKIIENSLIAQAPASAESFVASILSQFPKIREEGQNAIEEVSNTIPLLGEEVSSTIKAYIAENREEIQEFAKTHSEQEFAAYFMDDLFAHVVLDLDQKIKQSGEKGGWNAVKSVSLSRLVALNSYLEKLANTGRFDLTEKEQLERRAIVTWINLLEVE